MRDVTDKFTGCLKAEQKDKNVLILWHLDHPVKRVDGQKCEHQIEYLWLSDPEDLTSVQGSDYSYWLPSEIVGWEYVSLFDAFQLCP